MLPLLPTKINKHQEQNMVDKPNSKPISKWRRGVLADQLGLLAAQIAPISGTMLKIKNEMKKRGGRFDGDFYSTSISEVTRQSPDLVAIEEWLGEEQYEKFLRETTYLKINGPYVRKADAA